MTGQAQQIVQQTIVPAYVWQDEPQRQAVCVAAVLALQATAQREQLVLDGDVFDASVSPSYLKAQVGRSNVGGTDVPFVAYEACEAALADLVFIAVSMPVREP